MDTSRVADAVPGQPPRGSRRIRTLEEKLAILKEATAPGASMAAVARRYGLNANLLFAWRRLQQRGLLEGQRHAKVPALLPVKISTPTVTPSERAAPSLSARGGVKQPREGRPGEACVEIVLSSEVRLRIIGEAQRAIVSRVLELLSKR
jgi:transposase